MNNDPETYRDPREFRPERFLPPDSEIDYGVSFGFGRRVCPGRILGETSTFLIIAHTLAVFNITKPIGEDGRDIEPSLEFTTGALSHPLPFAASFRPRSPAHAQTVIDFEKAHPIGRGDSHILAQALKQGA